MLYRKHHIIPRCMGGSDEHDNLVELTAEEHYVAHQLLVKMYPHDNKLIYAANMMCVNATQRNNKAYGWIRRKWVSQLSKDRTGTKATEEQRKRCQNPIRETKTLCMGYAVIIILLMVKTLEKSNNNERKA